MAAAMESRGGYGGMKVVARASGVLDETTKAVVYDARQKPAAFLLRASTHAPQQVARAVAMARAVRERIGEDLGRAVLVPFADGTAGGLSYAVFPLCRPITGQGVRERARKRCVAPHVYRWLRRVSVATVADASDGEIEREFVAPLSALAADGAVDDDLRRRADAARSRILDGRWRPRHVLEHGDLWTGNILTGRSLYPAGFPCWATFAIIDWAGAKLRGRAIYDLVRLAETTDLRAGRLAKEVHSHCRTLRCEPADAAGYLLAAFGRIGMDLGAFPRATYLAQAGRSWSTLARAL
jgi:hypothetical protein